jgi:NADPH:quinone reductase-like Zn-dependent oxidoreductase
VKAVSINDWDAGLRQGDFINRLLNGPFRPKRKILGSDIAGTVEAVGSQASRFTVGDDVYGDLSGRWGGFAEYACAPEKALEIKPASMSYIDAAAIPQAAMLAVQGLVDKGKLGTGQKVLINGAGGGVGTFGVQIAKLHHAEVTGVDSERKLQMMTSLGFDHVIDYRKEDFTRNGKKYDLILDVKTNRPVSHYIPSLSPGGVYVTVGGSMRRLLQVMVMAGWISARHKKHFRIVSLKPNKDLPYINELYVAGKLKTVIDGPYRLEEAAEAFRVFEKGEHLGKMVFVV